MKLKLMVFLNHHFFRSPSISIHVTIYIYIYTSYRHRFISTSSSKKIRQIESRRKLTLRRSSPGGVCRPGRDSLRQARLALALQRPPELAHAAGLSVRAHLHAAQGEIPMGKAMGKSPWEIQGGKHIFSSGIRLKFRLHQTLDVSCHIYIYLAYRLWMTCYV